MLKYSFKDMASGSLFYASYSTSWLSARPSPRGMMLSYLVDHFSLALHLRGTSLRICRLQQATPDLVFFDRFKKGLEVALAKTVVAFALDEFEEDRAYDGL